MSKKVHLLGKFQHARCMSKVGARLKTTTDITLVTCVRCLKMNVAFPYTSAAIDKATGDKS